MFLNHANMDNSVVQYYYITQSNDLIGAVYIVVVTNYLATVSPDISEYVVFTRL